MCLAVRKRSLRKELHLVSDLEKECLRWLKLINRSKERRQRRMVTNNCIRRHEWQVDKFFRSMRERDNNLKAQMVLQMFLEVYLDQEKITQYSLVMVHMRLHHIENYNTSRLSFHKKIKIRLFIFLSREFQTRIWQALLHCKIMKAFLQQ